MKRNPTRLPLLLGALTLAALLIACGNEDAQVATTDTIDTTDTTDTTDTIDTIEATDTTETRNAVSKQPDVGANEKHASQKARAKVDDSAIRAIDEFIAGQSVDTSGSNWKTSLPMPPKLEFDAGKTYYWELDTNVGNVSIRLLPDVAPMHVSSAIYLTRLGFFDGLTFHRVIPKFMAQGGDPLGNGRGSPGYRFDGEFDSAVRHDKPGLLSQANAGPGTDGSQFFITFVPTPHLDDKHTIYGEVVDGMDTVKQLEQRRERGSPHMNEPLLIERAEIRVE